MELFPLPNPNVRIANLDKNKGFSKSISIGFMKSKDFPNLYSTSNIMNSIQ
jgi:hypothetical protein